MHDQTRVPQSFLKQASATPLRPPDPQRQCACARPGAHTTDCTACLSTSADSSHSDTRRAAEEPLRSPGQSIDSATRHVVEARFGHDFSRVRVHTDGPADGSARALGAVAYTSGHDIVFSRGQYAPGTSAGMRLLTHELTHVVQQTRRGRRGVASGPVAEQEAERNANSHHAVATTRFSAVPGLIQRQPVPAGSGAMPLPGAGSPSKIDATAQSIIDAAQDQSVPIGKRAEAAVWSIIRAYHSAKGANLTVTYDNKQAGSGLATTPPLQAKATSSLPAVIYVGDDFVNELRGSFARKVLQVGHELEHIDQYRSGMVGPLIKGTGVDTLKDEREFRAFFHEALGAEAANTGRVSHTSRIRFIDVALGYHNCLDAATQKTYGANQQHLLDRRKAEIDDMTKKNFKDVPTGPAPTACKRP